MTVSPTPQKPIESTGVVVLFPAPAPTRAGIFGDVPDPSACDETSSLPLTFAGVAERVAVHYGEILAYDADDDTWLAYNGNGLWQSSPALIHRMVMAAVRAITVHEVGYAEAKDPKIAELRAGIEKARSLGITDKAVEIEFETRVNAARKEHVSFGRRCEDKSRLVDFVLENLRDDLTVDHARWDHNTVNVNLLNGVYEVDKGVLREHRPDDYMTMQVPTNYVAGATSEDLDAVLAHFERNRAGSGQALLRSLGYSLTGVMDAKTMVSIYGARDSGKSSLTGALWAAIDGGKPTSYGASVQAKDFYVQRNGGSDTQPHLDRCRRKRWVMVPEAEHGYLASDLLKSITGEDPITTRTLRKEGGTWVPQFKITFIGQGPLQFDTADAGMIERLWPIPLTISLEVVDPQIRRRLNKTKEGHEAVIAAVLHAATAWYTHYRSSGDAKAALLIPDDVADLKKVYADATNPLAEWAEAYLVLSEERSTAGIGKFEEAHGNVGRADTSLLLRHFNWWSSRHGGAKISLKAFAKMLTSMGCPALDKPTSFAFTTPTGEQRMSGKFREGVRFTDEREWLRCTEVFGDGPNRA